ncbi:MAG: polyhydroxyalkanoate biosynthesis repressor PhaR [Candidatus Marinimicrobia bacterium]|nr:polyhydroxyalkanoate biosynthesis repressor PhaR [Candidatus Neomarinimicrobiota bacterium]|tara:strand:+ start:1020 stop:2066 length:1047 start_codon:yes stop_codon:yes gene_type:complete
MAPYIEIGNRKIGYDYDPLIIAEMGINHGGSLDVAFELVDAAAKSGAEILKHQTHIASDEMSSSAKKVIPAHTEESIYEIIDSCSLSKNEEIELQEYVQKKGMIFISTPFSRAAADRLIEMDVPAFKIGSGECNNYPLIKHIAKAGKPIIMSTGMNSIQSIIPSVDIFRQHKVPFALLHCTNIYPTPPELVRLGALNEIQKAFPDAVIGLSDHTTSNIPSLGAIALGASIIERHFTDTMSREGPDISCSMDPEALSELILQSKIMKSARGGSKGPVKEEGPTIDFAYASVVSIKDISAGEELSMENIWVKRPGTGEILAAEFEDLIGRIAKVDIQNDTLLKREYLADR